MKKIYEFYKEDIYLLMIFVMVSIGIILKSYFDSNGYLSFDSTNYLKLAQNLLEGKGYYVSAYSISGQDREFFAIWPIGYPTLIFLLAKLTGLSVFWASKLLNIVLIGIALMIFRILFKKYASVYGLIFLFSSYIEIFSYTWSETIFIVVLLWFAVSIYFFIIKSHKNIYLYMSIMISSLLLFMSRYIGAFSFGIIGLLGLYYGFFKREKSVGIALVSISLINIGFMILYLYHNYVETGFPTGMQRIPSPETNFQLFSMLIKALIAELLIPLQSISKKAILVFIIQFFFFGFLIWKYKNHIFFMKKEKFNERSSTLTLSYVFGTIGLTYLFFIILMRWLTQFDMYGYRLLAPGSFFLFLSFIFFLQHRTTKQFFTIFIYFLFSFSLLSYLLNVPYGIWISHKNNPTYSQNIKFIKQKFDGIEKNSIVIFAPKHVNYLYTDMQIKNPYALPYHSYKEKWSDFIVRIDPSYQKHIYLNIPEKKLSLKRYDKSVVDMVNKYPQGNLIKLK